MPNVIDNEALYSVITLNGKVSPGTVKLSGHNRRIKWNVKAGYSLEGASMALQNIPPIEFTATFYLVKDPAEGIDDYAAWDAWVPVLHSSVSGTLPKALPIYHPDLAENQITSVCKAEIGGRVYDGKGGCTIVVKLQEYRTPKKKGGGVASAPAQGAPPNAKQAVLADLVNRVQQNPWGGKPP